MQHPWGSEYLYAFPPFSMINKDLNKVISNLVCDFVKYFNRETNTFTTVPVSTHESTKTVAPTSDKQNLKISGVDSLKEKLLTGGL